MRLTLDPDTGTASLLEARLRELRSTLMLLEKSAAGLADEHGVFLAARVQDAYGLIDQAIRTLECETCDGVATVARESGTYCESCSARWVVCPVCKDDVPLSSAVQEGDEFYHVCCAPDNLSRILDWVSGE